MKKILMALLIVVSLATPAFAKDVTYKACTADNKESALVLSLVDDVKAEIEKHIGEAFAKAAKDLSAEDLANTPGYKAFVSNLTEEDKNAVDIVYGPPSVVGECK